MDPMQVGFVQFLLLLLGMGMGIMMFVILLLALIQSAPAMSAREWASADGIVVQSFISTEHDDEDAKASRIYYVPNVAYTYFAQDIQQLGTRIHFGAHKKNTVREGAEKDLSAYPVGARVTVYYDPERPNNSVLKREAPAAGRLGLVALGVMFVCIVAFAAAFLLPNLVG